MNSGIGDSCASGEDTASPLWKRVKMMDRDNCTKMDDKSLNPYKGKYQGQKGATGSRVYLDKEIK